MIRSLIFLFTLAVASSFLGQPNMADAAEVVHYELKEWKAKHIHDTKKADSIASTMKKLKIEVKKEQHNGHIDLKYRCPKKMQMPVKTHEDAMKWEKWFKEYGFKVYHTH